MSLLPLYSAFVGALIGQLLSHWLTNSRDSKKSNREAFKELIVPYLNDVLMYVLSATTAREHDVERKIEIKDIVEAIAKNINYGDSRLMSALLSFDKSKTFFDGRGNAEDTKRLELLYWFVDYANKVLRKVDDSDIGISMVEEVEETQKLLGVWAILTKVFDLDTSTTVLKKLTFLTTENFDDYTIGEISILVELETEDAHAIKILIEKIYNVLVDKVEEQEKEDIKKLLDK